MSVKAVDARLITHGLLKNLARQIQYVSLEVWIALTRNQDFLLTMFCWYKDLTSCRALYAESCR